MGFLPQPRIVTVRGHAARRSAYLSSADGSESIAHIEGKKALPPTVKVNGEESAPSINDSDAIPSVSVVWEAIMNDGLVCILDSLILHDEP